MFIYVLYYKTKKSRSRVKQISVCTDVTKMFFFFFHCIQAVTHCNEAESKHVCLRTCRMLALPLKKAYASDTEIMFKNDSPVAIPVESEGKQRQLESPVPQRCVTTRIRRSQTSNTGRRPDLLTATYLCEHTSG